MPTLRFREADLLQRIVRSGGGRFETFQHGLPAPGFPAVSLGAERAWAAVNWTSLRVADRPDAATWRTLTVTGAPHSVTVAAHLTNASSVTGFVREKLPALVPSGADLSRLAEALERNRTHSGAHGDTPTAPIYFAGDFVYGAVLDIQIDPDALIRRLASEHDLPKPADRPGYTASWALGEWGIGLSLERIAWQQRGDPRTLLSSSGDAFGDFVTLAHPAFPLPLGNLTATLRDLLARDGFAFNPTALDLRVDEQRRCL